MTGAVTNEGTIAPGMPVPIGGVVPTNALAIVLHSVIEGGIINSGTIMGISAAGTAVGINIHSSQVSGGGITNNGTIIASGPNLVAFWIIADSTSTITGTGAGNITNSGTIIASAGTFGAGIQLGAGGNTIVNTGTIFGSTVAIALDARLPHSSLGATRLVDLMRERRRLGDEAALLRGARRLRRPARSRRISPPFGSARRDEPGPLRDCASGCGGLAPG